MGGHKMEHLFGMTERKLETLPNEGGIWAILRDRWDFDSRKYGEEKSQNLNSLKENKDDAFYRALLVWWA